MGRTRPDRHGRPQAGPLGARPTLGRTRAGRGRGSLLAPLLALAILTGALLGVSLAVGVGDTAPDFTLQDLSGRSYTLGTYRGKLVLLALIGYG